MRLFRRITCAVRGHVALESLPTEPPPKEQAQRTLLNGLLNVAGISLVSPGAGYINGAGAQINVGPHNTPGLNGQTISLGSTGHGMRVNTAGPVLQIDYPGASHRMSVCARCQGVFWTYAPNLPALATVEQIPALKEYSDWNKREAWERQQRETNEAAGKLYKQYQMVLKLAAPTCDEVSE